MKLLSTLVLSVAALASAAVIDPANALVQRDDAVAEFAGNLETLAFQLSDGSQKVEFVLEGIYEGSLVQAAYGTGKSSPFAAGISPIGQTSGLFYLHTLHTLVQAFDANGAELNLDDLEVESDAGDIEKRNPLAIIRIVGAVIKKFGPRALAFFKCIGFTASAKCGQKVRANCTLIRFHL